MWMAKLAGIEAAMGGHSFAVVARSHDLLGWPTKQIVLI
jgi:hypothetical protein